MVHTPRNYQALRDEHSRAMDALNQQIEQSETPDRQKGVEQSAPEPSAELSAEQEPTRPEQGVGRSSSGGALTPDMKAQQEWATGYNNRVNADYFAWSAANSGERTQSQIDNAPTNAEHDAASAELNQRIDGQGRGDGNHVQDGRNDPGHEAASNALDQRIEGQDTGDKKIEGGRAESGYDALKSELDQRIEKPERGEIVQDFRETAQEIQQPYIDR